MTEPSDHFQGALPVYRAARAEFDSAIQWWDQFLPTDGSGAEPDNFAMREAYRIVRAAQHKYDRAFPGLWGAIKALPATEDEPWG